ncbi:hypothetical protein PGB34_01485 [Xenophilus arseniciresistens]|uniref:Metallothionein n=1 Tax=Xenophilus arseniciresistens TaxID=1283306 RepID=A0AAE3SY05_9BURK|nr:hypothetical protein [Xenophilus arseniciresistens]MDA7415025.1 hypothetical protein [Xenophilus arseniciresistens]
MSQCEVCGNEYHRPLLIKVDDTEHVFDSFECAIEGLAPRCGHCGCRIIGHGIEAGSQRYCCAHCARSSGVTGVADNAH